MDVASFVSHFTPTAFRPIPNQQVLTSTVPDSNSLGEFAEIVGIKVVIYQNKQCKITNYGHKICRLGEFQLVSRVQILANTN